MNYRLAKTEAKYQRDLSAGRTNPLRDEPSILETKHWRIIKNRYPYDRVASRHDLLIPKRVVDDVMCLNLRELWDLRRLYKTIRVDYDEVKLNCLSMLTITNHVHFHLLELKGKTPRGIKLADYPLKFEEI